jgi:hypothetical protein
VTTQLDTVRTAEIRYGIGIPEIPLALLRLDRLGLEIILCRDTVVVVLDYGNMLVITQIPHVDGYTDREIILVSILQALSLTTCAHSNSHCA